MTGMSAKWSQQHIRGFTLIELLVVIAVIAILMGVLMPALRAARRQAYGAVCQAQLKQWALCYNLYTDDHEGRFPPFFGGTVQTTFMESLRKLWPTGRFGSNRPRGYGN